MDYLRIYNQLVTKRQQQVPECYTEKHHIIPRCMGGSDELYNLVKLTLKEHFIAHQLLAKIHKSKSLLYAAYKMSNFKKYGSRKFVWLRELYLATPKSEEHKIAFSVAVGQANKDRIWSVYSRIKSSNTKKKKDNSAFANIGAIQAKNSIGTKQSDEIKQKRNASLMGHIVTQETRDKISNTKKLIREGKMTIEEYKTSEEYINNKRIIRKRYKDKIKLQKLGII